MSVELTILTLTALLAVSLWIPYIVGLNTTEFATPDENRPHDVAGTVPWVHRAYRAHLNLIEQFLPFAVIVLIAHLSGVSNDVTVWSAVLFLALRVVHAVWMIAGFKVFPARPLIFTGGWLCILAIGIAVLLG